MSEKKRFVQSKYAHYLQDTKTDTQYYLTSKKMGCKDLFDEIERLTEENEQLQKETVFLAYWKRKAMILLMQVRRLTPRMTDEEVMEFSKELDDE